MAIRSTIERPSGVTWPFRRPAPLALITVCVAVAVVAVLPIAYLILRALQGESGTIELLLRPRTAELLVSSVLLAAGVGIGATLLGVPLAWLTTRTDLPGRRAWTVLAIAPLAIPSYVLALAFIGAVGPRGAAADLLRDLGTERLPSVYGLPGALLVLTLATYPYVLLATRAALLRLDASVEEAARSLGDRPVAAFVRVVVPLLAPAIGAGALLAALYAISDFGAVSLLRVDSIASAIHIQYRTSFDRTGPAALALLLVAATAAIVLFEARVRRRVAVRQPHGGVHTSARPTALGRWRWPALAMCAAVVALALVLPTGTIMLWAARGITEEGMARDLLDPIGDSIVGAAAAAAVACALAIPVAVLTTRYRGRLADLIERMTYGAYAIPGICLALAVVFLTLSLAPALYQTLLILVLAYAIRFLPQATGATRGALMLVSPSLTDAARSLGERPVGVLRTVILPLLRPGLMAGAALVFLSTIKELPLTLLVAPTGFGTLATRIWDATNQGLYARAAVPAAVLVVISAVSVALLLREGEAHA